ncbi:Inner membrane protein YccS [Jannaschia seosinensis]|uniref:Inner membrane protein YccS n=1 Tax=Jannaschia seosinensis TaxID=313367 RepID=A0A0M7B6B2_9RHOB|nr:FUSC family protein [Jannaschia seosinensis]CUH08089.1 Inner membrane protein YccS [Jannaschia seosinensis]
MRAALPFDLPDRPALRDAARRATQAALGAVLAWAVLIPLPTDEYFVGILAAVLILNPSADGTLHAARTRLMATVVGCVVGVVCLAFLPPGWGGFVGLALSIAVLSAAAHFRPDWTYGIVAAVSLATSSGEAVWLAALDRTISIGIGAVIGILIALVLWPDRARPRFDKHIERVRQSLADLAAEVARKADQDDPDGKLPSIDRLRHHLRLAREAADVMAFDDSDAPNARLRAAEEMMRAIQFLHRATAAPVDLGEDTGLDDALCRFRDALSDALRTLPETGGPLSDGGPVTDAQRAVTERIENGGVAVARTATVLAFAMDEVDRALAACRTAWR